MELRNYATFNLVPSLPPSLPQRYHCIELYSEENQLEIKGVFKNRQENQRYQWSESLRNIKELLMQMRTVIPALATVKFCGEDQVRLLRR